MPLNLGPLPKRDGVGRSTRIADLFAPLILAAGNRPRTRAPPGYLNVISEPPQQAIEIIELFLRP
jgi:hypothetical protein